MIIKNHPEFIPHPQPPPIIPPPCPVFVWANAEIPKTNEIVNTISNLFIVFLLAKILLIL